MGDRIEISRTVPLLDYEIDRSGDGRTVIAYAATFDELYRVSDAEGIYDETINPAAFNRTINNGALRSVSVLFNHGLTAWGTPSDRYAMPVGTPVSITPEKRGLLTATRYAQTELGDEILQLWKDGAIRGQSFRGPVFRSAPARPGPNGRPIIERLELGLREYGPTPNPANAGAELVAVRSQLLAQVGEMTPEERRELAALLQADTPALDTHEDAADDTGSQPPVDAPAPGPSVPAFIEADVAARRRRA